MSKYFALFISLIVASQALAQDFNELARRNGFKDIKLGSSVDSIKGAGFEKDFMEMKEFEAKLYSVKNPEYEKIGEADVKSVELKVYKSLIYEIIVTTAKDPRIMRALEKSFGKATYNMRTETYAWRAPGQLSLVYKGHHKEIVLVYKSHPVIKLMYADKKKKVDEIADDF